ncbi:MAG: alpha/beta hydrolase [Roseivirga sp.]|nr:alpha/beta hydrolase [Roseivirga sp.]
MKSKTQKTKNLIGVMLSVLLAVSCSDDDKTPETVDDGQVGTISLGTHRLSTFSQVNDTEYLVVFESGHGYNTTGWFTNNLVDVIAQQSDVLLYDRAGYGDSEMGPGPRNIERLSSELAAVIDQYALGRKVILVSHSLGGLIARDYAIKHPSKVASMLFLDVSHEAYNDPSPEKEDMVYDITASNFGVTHGATMEIRELSEGLEYAATLPNLPDVPVIAISGMKEDAASAARNEFHGKTTQEWYDAHEELGEGITDFTHIGAQNVGHFVFIDDAELVIQAIQQLLAK